MRRALFLLAPALLIAAEGETLTVISAQPMRTLPLVVENLATVASARLYVTEDDGATWALAQELVIDPAATAAPRFAFTAPRDGSFGFVSAVTNRDQQREPEPRAGQPPTVRIVFDRTPPTITLFAARAEPAVAGHVNLRVSWTASDAGFGPDPAAVELSSDGGATFAPLQRVPAQGDLLTSVAVPAQATRLHLRLNVTDRAGNQVLGPVAAVKLPPPPADDAALIGALAALPSSEAPAPQPVPAEPALVPAFAPPVVAQARPDIVVPPAPAPTPTTAPDIVRGGGLEQEYRSQRDPAEKPSGAWQGRTRDRAVDAGGGKPADPEQPAAPKPVERPTLPPGIPPAGMLSPQQSQAVLDAARTALARDDLPAAQVLYRRLRGGPLSETAIIEELRALRSRNRAAEGLTAVASLAAELRSDPVRIEHGRLLLASNRPDEAVTVVSEIKRTAPQAAEALLLIGDALHAKGQKDQARKVWTAVERGGGDQARPARERLAATR